MERGKALEKKLTAIFLAFVLVVTFVSMFRAQEVYADNIPATGNCGTRGDSGYSANATFAYASDTGKLTISGTGEIGSRAFADYTNKANIKEISVGAGITKISPNAFEGLTGVTTVTLPSGLLSIGFQAFYNCFNLDTIKFPATLEEIDSQAFYNDGISEIDIPASMKKLNWDAFGAESGYGSISKVIMRSSDIEFVEPLVNKIPNTIHSAGPIGGNYDYQFAWTDKIPDQAFNYLKNNDRKELSSIVLPATITKIGSSAFSGQSNLDAVELPNGLTAIDSYAFYGTGLENVTIPASVTEIGRQAFNSCTDLEKITIQNAECSIYDVYDNERTINTGATIAGYDDSTAKVYAEKYGYTFESLGAAPCPSGGVHDWHLVNHKATFTKAGYQSMECSKCKALSQDGIAAGAAAVTTVKLAKTSYVYTGSAIKPTVTLATADGPLNKNYYTLTYSNNTDVGTGSVKIQLQGDYYEGTKTLKFSITKKAITPTVTLSATSYVYNGTVRKPSVVVKDGNKKLSTAYYDVTYSKGLKAVGTYSVKVTLKGNYSGSKTVKFTIVPKGTSISKLTPAKKGFTVKWAKQAAQTTGYQIQYSTSSTFKSGNKTVTVKGVKNVSKAISKLASGKKYYVRIRTYKTVGSKNYFSAWSKTMAVKTK